MTFSYHRDGLEIWPGLFPNEMLEATLGALMDLPRTAMPHRSVPEAMAMMKHPALVTAVESMIGPASGLGSDWFPDSPALDFHQDNGYVLARPELFMSVWIPFCDVNENNGCLWYVPGSHRWGLMDMTPPVGAVALHVKRGEAVALHGDLIHGSRGSPQPRPVLLLTYIRKGAPFKPGTKQQRAEVRLD